MNDLITRRDVLRFAGAAAVSGSLGGLCAAGSAPPIGASNESGSSKKRLVRLAHLTDIHVQPERRAADGLIACLRHLQSLPDRPELILTGGDSVMDSFEADDARTTVQWDLWRSVFKNECGVRVHSCIGNHDIWGWNKSRSKTTGNEPSYGKRRATEMLGLQERYYSFDLGWHIVVLDSTQSDGGDRYRAYLDPVQFDWLVRDLSSTPASQPVLVLSHIPILAPSALLFAKRNDRGEFTVPDSLVHQDALKLKNLFARHSNVKLCLSGHLHHVDRTDYNGVTYLCNGAVSGNWWKGRHHDCDEGYALIGLFDDGSFQHEYVKYGWKAAT